VNRSLRVTAVLALAACTTRPEPRPAPAPAETRDARWQQDLQYLASELPALHGNLFHTLDRGAFAAAA